MFYGWLAAWGIHYQKKKNNTLHTAVRWKISSRLACCKLCVILRSRVLLVCTPEYMVFVGFNTVLSRSTVAPPTLLERNRRFCTPVPSRISLNTVPLAAPTPSFDSPLQTRKNSNELCFVASFLLSSGHETFVR